MPINLDRAEQIGEENEPPAPKSDLLFGNTEDKINISTLKNGIYFMKILGDKPKLIKIIKK